MIGNEIQCISTEGKAVVRYFQIWATAKSKQTRLGRCCTLQIAFLGDASSLLRSLPPPRRRQYCQHTGNNSPRPSDKNSRVVGGRHRYNYHKTSETLGRELQQGRNYNKSFFLLI